MQLNSNLMQLSSTQKVGFQLLLEQEQRAQTATRNFVRDCIVELGADPKKNYVISDSFELVEQE